MSNFFHPSFPEKSQTERGRGASYASVRLIKNRARTQTAPLNQELRVCVCVCVCVLMCACGCFASALAVRNKRCVATLCGSSFVVLKHTSVTAKWGELCELRKSVRSSAQVWLQECKAISVIMLRSWHWLLWDLAYLRLDSQVTLGSKSCIHPNDLVISWDPRKYSRQLQVGLCVQLPWYSSYLENLIWNQLINLRL